jgi:hypothetical protein
VELSGGQFLPPVQTLVATFIFFRYLRKKMQIESCCQGGVFFGMVFRPQDSNRSNAARMSAAGDGSTEPNID